MYAASIEYVLIQAIHFEEKNYSLGRSNRHFTYSLYRYILKHVTHFIPRCLKKILFI